MVFYMVISLWAVAGCSDDDTVAEPTSEIPGITRTSPENVLEILLLSLNEQDGLRWESVLSSNYEYIPDTESAEKFPGVFDAWDFDAEANFVRGFFSAGVNINARMLQEDFVVPDVGGRVEVRWDSVKYSVTVIAAGDHSSITYSGVADLVFRFEGNFWYLLSWEDISGIAASWNPSVVLPTLGELRGVFSSY